MNNSHLIELIKTLTLEEWTEFSRYMSYISISKKAEDDESYRLFKHITNCFPVADSMELTKEVAFQVLYPNQKNILGKMDKIMVHLHKHLKHFLLQDKYFDSKNEFNQLLDLSQIYKERGLTARYNQTINIIESNYIKESKISFENLLKKYIFEYEKHDWLSLHNKHDNNLNLPNTIESLYVFYNTTMIELINRLSIQMWTHYIETPSFCLDIISNFKLNISNLLFENILFNIQFKLNEIINGKNANHDDISEISDLLIKSKSKFENIITKSLSTYLRNICVLSIGRGALHLESVLFKLQKEHLKNGYLYHNNKIATTTYFAVASTAIRVKEYEWAYDFINIHKELLIGNTEGDIYYKLNMSIYYFETKKYDYMFNEIVFNFPEIGNIIIARRLELKAYYETRSELTSYKLDALKMYINRISHKSLPPAKKEHHLNFINLFSQIVQSIPGDKARSQKLIKRILAKKVVADRDWLLEKAREIGNLSDDEYAEAIKNPPTKE
jgi:hypothetical protein